MGQVISARLGQPPVSQHRVRWASRLGPKGLGVRGAELWLQSGQLEDGAGQLVPGALAPAGDMPGTVVAGRDEPRKASVEVAEKR